MVQWALSSILTAIMQMNNCTKQHEHICAIKFNDKLTVGYNNDDHSYIHCHHVADL